MPISNPTPQTEVSALLLFRYKANTSSTIGSGIQNGQVRWNAATQNSATAIHVSVVTDDGIDLTNLFGKISIGAILNTQDRINATKYQRWTVTNITNLTTYYTFGVAVLDSGTTNIGNAVNMVFAINTI